jgi:hypothetical protein
MSWSGPQHLVTGDPETLGDPATGRCGATQMMPSRFEVPRRSPTRFAPARTGTGCFDIARNIYYVCNNDTCSKARFLMSPTIRISQGTYDHLKEHAEPFMSMVSKPQGKQRKPMGQPSAAADQVPRVLPDRAHADARRIRHRGHRGARCSPRKPMRYRFFECWLITVGAPARTKCSTRWSHCLAMD